MRMDSLEKGSESSTSFFINGISDAMIVITLCSQNQLILETKDVGIPTACPMLLPTEPSVSPTRRSVNTMAFLHPQHLSGQSCGEGFNTGSLGSSP